MAMRWYILSALLLGSILPMQALRRRRPKGKREVHTGMILKSTAFANNGSIPQMYTCDGQDVSPPFRWSHAPEGTKSFVLTCIDLDKPGGGAIFSHWVVFNLPASLIYLPVNANIEYYKGVEGTNSMGKINWSGPCPLVKVRRYRFTLYALSAEQLRLTKKAKLHEVKRAMSGKVLAKASMIGTYEKVRRKHKREG